MKRCCKCREFRPYDQFSKNRKTKDGLRYECRPCRIAEYAKARLGLPGRRLPIPAPPGHKFCGRCQSFKPVHEFSAASLTRDKLHTWCKSCCKTYQARYRNENLAKVSSARAKYKVLNSERIKDWYRDYYQKNRERRLAQFAAYRAEMQAQNKPEALRPTLTKSGFKARLRRVRRRVNGGTYTKSDIIDIFQMQRGRCGNPACRSRLRENCEIDHIMPILLGGNSHRRNLQLLCRPCNRKKRDKHPIDFAAEGGFLL